MLRFSLKQCYDKLQASVKMGEKLTIDIVRTWLKTVDPGREFHYTKVLDGQVDSSLYGHLRKIMHDLTESKDIKPSGNRDGFYKVIAKVQPVKWWEADARVYYDLRHPRSHKDNTTFGLDELVNISPGDLILISGVSNYGKTCVAFNYVGENLGLHRCLVMGNEYTTLDSMPSPKLKRRIDNMNWAHWFNGSNEPQFQLLPVRAEFESYVQKGALNVIDWINMPENPYLIGRVLEDIKAKLGDGVAIVVIQKSRTSDLGVGGQFTEHFADLYLTIDPYGDFQSRITIGKVKDSKGRATGRGWAFKIEDNGANLAAIREIEKCRKCFGKGMTQKGRCCDCDGLGWVEMTNRNPEGKQ